MRFPGFIGPSYTLQSPNVDAQRCVNLYPEMNELGTGKEREVAALVGTPGLRSLVTLPTGPVRGVYTASNGTLYAVGGNTLYEISTLWVATSRGTLNTSLGPVSMSDNGTHVIVVDGAYGYVWNVNTLAFAQISDPDFPGADQVTYQDGYFLFNRPNTGQFFISAINDGTAYDALDIATAEGSPDNLVGLISDHQNVYLFGDYSTEVFYDSGDALFPFARTQGAIIEVGCAAAFSVGKIQNAVYWLGQDESGRGIVYRAQGYQPQRISNHALEKVIAGLDTVAAARAWTYQQGGHSFYCLNLPGAETTWVYDASTQLWHERAYLGANGYERHRADCHAYAYATNVVGDYNTGGLYALDPDTYTDNGTAVPRERASPHSSQDLARLFHSRFQLDMETGVGIDGSGQGSAPVAVLQWSDDGGHSWSTEREASIGAIGARSVRAIWRRLGSSRDRVYRVKITDPVKVTMIGAEVDVEGGAA
jgi:hypothetical protein